MPNQCVYDQMTNTGKPPTLPGMYPSILLTSYCWFATPAAANKLGSAVDEATIVRNVTSAYKKTPYATFTIDIENHRIGDDATYREAMLGYQQLVKAVTVARRSVSAPIGFYSLCPTREFWLTSEDDRTSWRMRNDNLLEMLDGKVDYLAPSIYMLYDEESTWAPYAAANILEAQRLANSCEIPVYCYLSPRNSGAGAQKEKFVSGPHMAKMLNFVLDHGCSVVLWDQIVPWSPVTNPAQQAILDVMAKRFGAVA